MIRTNEGALAYEHSLDHALEFFSKAGSLFTKRKSFYKSEESALSLFQKTWIVDKVLSMKLLLWLRDCRSGAGNRSGARECYKWLADNDYEWIIVNLKNIVKVGRWDDLRVLFGTKCDFTASLIWANAIEESNVLAAKWADRNDAPLRNRLKMGIGEFRRYLAKKRKQHIVEHKMCSNQWQEIEYKKVPSVAMSRYTNAFTKHDEDRFLKYKEGLKSGKETIHASVLFPHDCVRTVKNGDEEIGEAQFNALPNYLEKANERIIVIADTSGSMGCSISGSIQAVDISQSLALYCSAKIPENNPFHKKFIAFCSESEFKNWNKMTFSQAVYDDDIFDRAVGNTRIDTALDLMLETVLFFNLTQEQIPTTLLIVSDMQFHNGSNTNDTEVERCLKKWDRANYNRPKIVYWNTAGYVGQQATATMKNVALISGFSPSILKSLFTGEDMSPIAVMMKTLEKYNVNVPD